MNIDSKYWSYCKEIGIMKENYSRQGALDTLIKEVKALKTADPKFIDYVSNLTLNSNEVSVRSCMLYRYDIDLTYSVHGNIQHGKISDFGQAGVYDSLHITDYKGKGDYTVLKDFSSVPQIYNDRNLFTKDEMKSALKKIIEDQVPSGTTSYESEDWSVSAYIVPVLCVRAEFGGQVYDLVYNLQNGYYRWAWPDDPALIQKGKKMRTISYLLKAAAIALPLIGIFIALISSDPAWLLVGIAAAIWVLNIVGIVKTKKSKKYYEKYFINNPSKKLINGLQMSITFAALGLVAFLLGAIAF